jgi:hypothetical protein
VGHDWSDIATKGFVVVREFLDSKERACMLEGYARAERIAIDYDRRVRQVLERSVDLDVVAPIRGKIDQALRDIASTTDVHCDLVMRVYYFAAKVSTYTWHQDMDFWAQDRPRLLNFYIPLQKPAPEKTNLRLVPNDALARVASGLVGSGGRTFRPIAEEGSTEVIDVAAGQRYTIPADIEALGVTPQLAEGDLLVVRGDVVHRTEDADTTRIALSVRVANRASSIERDGLLVGPPSKRRVMEGLAHEYGPILRCFSMLGTDRITIGRLAEFLDTPEGRKPLQDGEMDALLRAGTWRVTP